MTTDGHAPICIPSRAPEHATKNALISMAIGIAAGRGDVVSTDSERLLRGLPSEHLRQIARKLADSPDLTLARAF